MPKMPSKISKRPPPAVSRQSNARPVKLSQAQKIERISEGKRYMADFANAMNLRERDLARYYLFDAGMAFAEAGYVLGSSKVLRLLEKENARLCGEDTPDSRKVAGEIAKKIAEIRMVLQSAWRQGSRSLP